MQKRVIEYSDQVRSADSYACQFASRIKKAETRGAKFLPGQNISERMLDTFERTGTLVSDGFNPSCGLSNSERKAIRDRINESYDRHARQDERDADFRAKLANQKKLEKVGLCLVQEEEQKENYLFI